MLGKVSIMGVLAAGFLITISCMSQGYPKKEETTKFSTAQNLPRLVTPNQLIFLDSISKITLFNMVDSEYEGIKKSKIRKVLTSEESILFLNALKNAVKDTALTNGSTFDDAYKIVVEGETDFLTLMVDSSFKQIKIGDVRSGVTTSKADNEFLNTLKSIVENE